MSYRGTITVACKKHLMHVVGEVLVAVTSTYLPVGVDQTALAGAYLLADPALPNWVSNP